MSNSKNTPTPWTISLTHSLHIVSDAPDHRYTPVANCDMNNENRTETDKANAALIVRSVNMYEELVLALKSLTEFAEQYGVSDRASEEDWSGHLNEARALLKKATE